MQMMILVERTRASEKTARRVNLLVFARTPQTCSLFCLEFNQRFYSASWVRLAAAAAAAVVVVLVVLVAAVVVVVSKLSFKYEIFGPN